MRFIQGMCWKCWVITIACLLGMVVVAVGGGGMIHDNTAFHRVAYGGAGLIVVALIADRIHKRHP